MIMVIGGRCQGKSSFAKEHFENRVQEKGKTQETCLEDHQKDPKADHWGNIHLGRIPYFHLVPEFSPAGTPDFKKR